MSNGKVFPGEFKELLHILEIGDVSWTEAMSEVRRLRALQNEHPHAMKDLERASRFVHAFRGDNMKVETALLAAEFGKVRNENKTLGEQLDDDRERYANAPVHEMTLEEFRKDQQLASKLNREGKRIIITENGKVVMRMSPIFED